MITRQETTRLGTARLTRNQRAAARREIAGRHFSVRMVAGEAWVTLPPLPTPDELGRRIRRRTIHSFIVMVALAAALGWALSVGLAAIGGDR